MNIVLLGTALLMGLVGQVHCATMCSGMAAVTCGGPDHGARRTAGVHVGRIASYAVQGALLAALGAAVASRAPVHDAQLVVRLLAGMALIAAGAQLAGIASPMARIDRWLAAPVRRASGWLGSSSGSGVFGDVARGFAWGLLPCGLLQGALALSLAAGSAPAGAIVMIAFGLGTLPVLLVVARLSRQVLSLVQQPRVRRAAGGLILLSGTAQIAMVALDLGIIRLGEEVRPCCAGRAH